MSQTTQEPILHPLHTEHEIAEVTLIVALDRCIELERRRYKELIDDLRLLETMGVRDGDAYWSLIDLVAASCRRSIRCRDLRATLVRSAPLFQEAA